ncbi:hypothetical protein GCM10020219_071450 [Nonomuraea dietziae]
MPAWAWAAGATSWPGTASPTPSSRRTGSSRAPSCRTSSAWTSSTRSSPAASTPTGRGRRATTSPTCTAHSGRFPGDEGLTALVDELLELSPDFARLWTEHPVSNCASIARDHLHPEHGVLSLTAEFLRTPDDEGQGVTLFQPAPGSPSATRLRALAAELTRSAARP